MLLGGRQGGVITRNIDLISRIFGPELEGRTWDRILGQILTFFTNTSKQIAGLFFYCRVHKYPGDKCHPGYIKWPAVVKLGWINHYRKPGPRTYEMSKEACKQNEKKSPNINLENCS